MKREKGFYWVKYKGVWLLSYSEDDIWTDAMSFLTFLDEDLDEIDERMIVRDETK